MYKTSGRRALLMLQAAVVLFVTTAWAQPTGGEATVYAIGISRIPRGDMAAGREEAIKAGLIMAVSRALTDTLPIESIVGRFQVVNETVLTRTDQFVRDYKVLTESVVGDTYRLVVQATVSIERLKETVTAAGIRMGEIPQSRVLLCVAETHLDDLGPRYWWSGEASAGERFAEAALSKIFSGRGFVMIRSDRARVGADYPPDLSATEAVDLGRRFEADVVVVGSARIEQRTDAAQGSARSYRATLRTTAYRTSDVRLLAQVEKTATTAGEGTDEGGEALRRAAAMAGEELAGKIAQASFKQAALGTGIEIRVQKVGGHIANLVKFRGALSGIPGVDNLQMRELASDTAVITVNYQGTARALADAVLLLNFDTFRIDVMRADAGTIEMQMVTR